VKDTDKAMAKNLEGDRKTEECIRRRRPVDKAT